MKRFKTVDSFIEHSGVWKEKLTLLRELMVDLQLEETIKWGAPTYCVNGKNVVGLGSFKSYCGLWFYQGVFLSDPQALLINAQEGKTQAMRQIRFQERDSINIDVIRAYVLEAIENQKLGKEVKPTRKKEIQLPQELEQALSNSELRAAFEQLTLGKRNEYSEYIAEAKREATRLSRTEKVIPMIMEGKGLNDKYR